MAALAEKRKLGLTPDVLLPLAGGRYRHLRFSKQLRLPQMALLDVSQPSASFLYAPVATERLRRA
ncbi:MAG TPA: hypothetical protein VHP37_15295 [Burkholderiales bacterium]|nr:hypothetical protein [Burkholderiales bacterium]